MTENDINIAIAEACGWKHEIRRSYRETPGWFHPNGVSMYDNPPAYFTDLNAMHDAEGWMNIDGYRGYEYDMILCKVVKAYEIGEPCNHMRLYHANAAQRAEAFLRTIGKWQEEKQ